MNKIIVIFFISLIFNSCSRDYISIASPEKEESAFISAVDISRYPEISDFNPTFYDVDGNPKEFLNILKDNGVNTIRLRLWVNPANEHSGFSEVKAFSKELRSIGFKIWLTLHYSDTWADPAHQDPPMQWQGLKFDQVKDSVAHHTEKIMIELQPDYIQIGNEVNSGFLHPYGEISQNFRQFEELMNTAIAAVRGNSMDTRIILHFAGIDGSDWFFHQVNTLDYDIIGLSYYPIWHGKSLNKLKAQMQSLGETYNKEILIAETAYPFTLDWKDMTNNVVGAEEQMILPDYPASPEGQKKFMEKIKSLIQEVGNGIGFCYWGAELIAWKGAQATNASPWENQALFDFDNKALPAWKVFNNK